MNYKDINTYDYNLDESLIAQTPIKERDHSKLLVLIKIMVIIKMKYFIIL